MNVGNFLIGSVALSLVLISGTLALVSFRLLFHLERLGHTGAKEFEMTLKTMERMAEKSASDLSILQGHSAERTEASRQPPQRMVELDLGEAFGAEDPTGEDTPNMPLGGNPPMGYTAPPNT